MFRPWGPFILTQEVQEAGFEGRPPTHSKAGEEIEEITQLIINIVQQTTRQRELKF